MNRMVRHDCPTCERETAAIIRGRGSDERFYCFDCGTVVSADAVTTAEDAMTDRDRAALADDEA